MRESNARFEAKAEALCVEEAALRARVRAMEKDKERLLLQTSALERQLQNGSHTATALEEVHLENALL